MEWLLGKIFEKFGDKFAFLKPFNIVYNREKKACYLTFLYPQNITFLEQDKKELVSFVQSLLNLNAKVEVKFKKSYLDEEFIFKSLLSFLSTNYPSIKGFIDLNSLKLTRDFNLIKIKLKLDEEFLKYISEDALKSEAKKYLENNFCSEFALEVIPDKISKEVKLENKVKMALPVARYEVRVVSNLFGGEIAPNPEFIKNIKTNKKLVILAGKIENLEKKSYEVKNGKKKGQTKFYYSFVLNDSTGKIESRHFATLSSEKKMDSLTGGSCVLILGDVEVVGLRQTLYVKALSLCTLPEKIEYKASVSKEYEVVNVEPFSVLLQENLFKTQQTFSDEITKNVFVVFDVETTGLNFEEDELLEIGAVKIENGNIVSKFSSLIKPSRPIPPSATLINNITNEMVKACPSVGPVIRDFFRYTRGAKLVGYNVSFDQKFILNAARKEGLVFDNEFMDLMPLAKMKLRLSRYRLSDVVKRLEISLDNAHRACSDALATAEAFLKLNSKEFW